jgi:hypothetical protein
MLFRGAPGKVMKTKVYFYKVLSKLNLTDFFPTFFAILLVKY